MRDRSWWLTATVAVVLTACGGPGPADDGPTGPSAVADSGLRRPGEPFTASGDWNEQAWPDPCMLAPGATGVLAAAPSAGTEPATSHTCRFRLADGRLGSLELLLVSETADDAWSAYQFEVVLRRDVTGIGEQAFLAKHEPSPEALWVCQGRTIFVVSADGPAGEALRGHLLAIAQEAVSRLTEGPAGTPLSG